MISEKPPPTPAPGSGKCLSLFEPYGHNCYLLYNLQQGYSWPDARHYCQLLHGQLASVHSRAEVEFIRNLNRTWHHDLWIGLTRDNNCKARGNRLGEKKRKGYTLRLPVTLTHCAFAVGWAWTDHSSLGFVNWAPGEPNQAFHPGEAVDENCVEMRSDGSWNDNNCLAKRGFVCQHRQCKSTLPLLLFFFFFFKLISL